MIKEARTLLEQHPVIDEKYFGGLVYDYFNNMVRGNRLSIRESLFDDPPNAGEKNISSFQLIKVLPFYVDVFNEKDTEAQGTWKEYEEKVLSEHDPLKRRKNYLQIKADLAKYIIFVPERDGRDSNLSGLLVYGRLFRLPYEYWDRYYDASTGFKRASLRMETFESYDDDSSGYF